MDYFLVQEFRERLVERYEACDLVELLGITTEELWEHFSDRALTSPGLSEELGMTSLIDEE